MKKKILALALSLGMLTTFNTVNASSYNWIKSNNTWKLIKDGSAVKNSWDYYNGNWYHFDNNGLMQTGWKLINGKWYSFTQDGQMRLKWYLENGKWYYLGTDGDMKTGWYKTTDKNWSYFKPSGEMVSNTLVKANDGEDYIIDKNGYTLNNTNGQTREINGNKYLLGYKNDCFIIKKNKWYFEETVYEYSGSTLIDAETDKVAPNENINPENVVKNFKNFEKKYYFGNDGKLVSPTPEFNGIDVEFYTEGDKIKVSDNAYDFTLSGDISVVNNKLYAIDTTKKEVLTGYNAIIADGAWYYGYSILYYSNEKGEIVKMKRLDKEFDDFIGKEIDGFFNDKIIIDRQTYKVKVVK